MRWQRTSAAPSRPNSWDETKHAHLPCAPPSATTCMLATPDALGAPLPSLLSVAFTTVAERERPASVQRRGYHGTALRDACRAPPPRNRPALKQTRTRGSCPARLSWCVVDECALAGTAARFPDRPVLVHPSARMSAGRSQTTTAHRVGAVRICHVGFHERSPLDEPAREMGRP